ncbi:MAG: hypothetical protein K2I74_06395 [Treponemataceae bacterium]|nr:hypothetical protein [Treponemataceae bacterium]
MRMTARMFGVLCAASLVFCAACDGIGNKDEDEDNPVVTVSYDVGKIVTFMERQYLVTKNSEGAVTTELTAVQATDLGTYYPNERADAYRKKLLADYGVTAYVELFDITEGKEISPSSGDSALYDTYIILHGGKGIYKIRQRRIAKDLFSGDDAESRSQPFKAKTNDELRQNYDPNLIAITNTLFETNLAKKFQEEYNFIYAGDKDADKQTLTYSDSELDYVFKKLNYAKVNGSERNVYGFRERNAVAGKRVNGERCWELNHLNANSRFFEFNIIADGSYRLSAYGEGTVDGSASDTVYKGTLTIKGVQYDSSGKLDLRYDVGIKKNGSTISKSILPEGFDDNFVIKSSRMVSVEGVNFNVHETITFFVPFFNDNFVVNHNAVLNKYTKVTFVPKAENGGVIYVPKTDTAYPYDFIAQFVKDYQSLFGKGGSSLPTDVELQPDTDVDTDTTTPRFMFTGDSLRIELEEMKHNFVLSEEPAASGGKSGKLVDENSRAEAIITFPAGTYSGYAVIRAPSGDNDAFYVKFGDNYIRVYADDPLPTGYARTSRTPINLSCSNEVTVRMTILKDSPDKSGETGMFIDYVEFTKAGSQAGQGGSGGEDNPKVTYEVGTIMTMSSGTTYLVTKNSEVANGLTATGTVTTDWGTYYQNESAAAYREKLLAGCNVTTYIELFDLSSSKGDDKLDDRYIILCNRKHYYTITQSWVKANMPAEGTTAFADMTENGLREQYDPNVVVFYNEVADFGTDLSKKIYKKYTFAYNDYSRVSFTNDNMTQFEENKAYRWINGGTQWRGSYSVTTKKENDGREKKSYNLKEGMVNKSFANFDRYSDGTYRVVCKGVGTLGGETSDQVYQNLITIRKLQYSADAPTGEIDYSVRMRKNGEEENKNYTTFDPNEHNCLEISAATVMMSGIPVPATITFIARYEDADAPLGKYTKLIFEPQAKDGVVVYEPKTDRDYDYDFVRRFIDDYQSLYAGAFPSL